VIVALARAAMLAADRHVPSRKTDRTRRNMHTSRIARTRA
jgi:hypothetical protein